MYSRSKDTNHPPLEVKLLRYCPNGDFARIHYLLYNNIFVAINRFDDTHTQHTSARATEYLR